MGGEEENLKGKRKKVQGKSNSKEKNDKQQLRSKIVVNVK